MLNCQKKLTPLVPPDPCCSVHTVFRKLIILGEVDLKRLLLKKSYITKAALENLGILFPEKEIKHLALLF